MKLIESVLHFWKKKSCSHLKNVKTYYLEIPYTFHVCGKVQNDFMTYMVYFYCEDCGEFIELDEIGRCRYLSLGFLILVLKAFMFWAFMVIFINLISKGE